MEGVYGQGAGGGPQLISYGVPSTNLDRKTCADSVQTLHRVIEGLGHPQTWDRSPEDAEGRQYSQGCCNSVYTFQKVTTMCKSLKIQTIQLVGKIELGSIFKNYQQHVKKRARKNGCIALYAE
jgi:hypothetical protein